MTNKNVLIIGIGGHIGYTTSIYLNNLVYNVIGTYNKNYPNYPKEIKKKKRLN